MASARPEDDAKGKSQEDVNGSEGMMAGGPKKDDSQEDIREETGTCQGGRTLRVGEDASG